MAAGFVFDVFSVVVPAAGTALTLFILTDYFVKRTSRLAFVITLVVLNPPVKWAIYGVSFWLGLHLLGPASGASVVNVSLSFDFDILLRQLVSSMILAVVLAVVSYVVTPQLTRLYHRQQWSTSPAGAAGSRNDNTRPDALS